MALEWVQQLRWNLNINYCLGKLNNFKWTIRIRGKNLSNWYWINIFKNTINSAAVFSIPIRFNVKWFDNLIFKIINGFKHIIFIKSIPQWFKYIGIKKVEKIIFFFFIQIQWTNTPCNTEYGLRIPGHAKTDSEYLAIIYFMNPWSQWP